jgi:hypothetical protein
MSSLKMGLDQAVLSGFEGGGERSLSKEEVEKLLRCGAYVLDEDKDGSEAASNAFAVDDIDTILQRCAKNVVHDNSAAAGGKFSKARFSKALPAAGGTTVEIDDPNFW